MQQMWRNIMLRRAILIGMVMLLLALIALVWWLKVRRTKNTFLPSAQQLSVCVRWQWGGSHGSDAGEGSSKTATDEPT